MVFFVALIYCSRGEGAVHKYFLFTAAVDLGVGGSSHHEAVAVVKGRTFLQQWTKQPAADITFKFDIFGTSLNIVLFSLKTLDADPLIFGL